MDGSFQNLHREGPENMLVTCWQTAGATAAAGTNIEATYAKVPDGLQLSNPENISKPLQSQDMKDVAGSDMAEQANLQADVRNSRNSHSSLQQTSIHPDSGVVAGKTLGMYFNLG